jgi:hypothetical protein
MVKVFAFRENKMGFGYGVYPSIQGRSLHQPLRAPRRRNMVTYKETIRAIKAGYDLFPSDRKWHHQARKQDFVLEVRFSKFLEELTPGQLERLRELAFPKKKD